MSVLIGTKMIYGSLVLLVVCFVVGHMEPISFDDEKPVSFGGGMEFLLPSGEERGNHTDFAQLESELSALPSMEGGDDFMPMYEGGTTTTLPEPTAAAAAAAPDLPTGGWSSYGGPTMDEIPRRERERIQHKEREESNDELKQKLKYVRLLEQIERKGGTLTKKYTMESTLADMMCEYESLMDDKRRQNSIKFQSNLMLQLIGGVEYINGRMDPFGINLDGWSEQVGDTIDDYEPLFDELHTRYSHLGTVAPELRLIFQLVSSAAMVHFTNQMVKGALPSMDEVFRQHPDLMRSFQTAAVNTLGQQHPQMAHFLSSGSAQPGQQRFPPPPPPPPVEQQPRPTMRGPPSLESMLSGLKTRDVQLEDTESVASTATTTRKRGGAGAAGASGAKRKRTTHVDI